MPAPASPTHSSRVLRDLPVLGVVVSHVVLLVLWDLASAPVATVVTLIAGTVAVAWVAERRVLGAATILVVAVILRLLLLALPPTLSDDLLRYVWDGRVLTEGIDPYRHAPEDPALTALRDPRWQIMSHRDVPTVYPPIALVVFAVGSWLLPWPFLGVKILLTLVDLGACALLIRLAHVRGRPPTRVVWYAWHPLVVLEIAGMGHVDALVAAALVATVLLLVERRDASAGLAAACGVLAKLHPLILIPAWCRFVRRRARFLLAAGLLTGLALVPVLLPGIPPGLVTYGVSWEFNGPLYEPLWRLLDVVEADGSIKTGVLDTLKSHTGEHERWNRFYPFVYPQLLAKLVLLGGFGLYWLWASFVARADPVVVTGRVLTAFVLAMATVYPWYLLAVLPFAALVRHRAWLAVSVLMPLVYLPQHLDQPLWPSYWAVVWVPFFVLLPMSLWHAPADVGVGDVDVDEGDVDSGVGDTVRSETAQ